MVMQDKIEKSHQEYQSQPQILLDSWKLWVLTESSLSICIQDKFKVSSGQESLSTISKLMLSLLPISRKNKNVQLVNPVIVSPDAGGDAREKKFQEAFKSELNLPNTGLAMIIKHREQAGKIAKMHLVGNVDKSDIIIIDDMIDTAGTLSEASRELKKMGANRVFCFATHGLFSGNAYENINNSDIERVIVTNTIPAKPAEKDCPKIKRLSIASLLAEAIRRVQAKESVSDLFASPHKK